MKDPVDGEYPFQWSVTRRRIQVMGARGLSVFFGLAPRHDAIPVFAFRREHAVEASEVRGGLDTSAASRAMKSR